MGHRFVLFVLGFCIALAGMVIFGHTKFLLFQQPADDGELVLGISFSTDHYNNKGKVGTSRTTAAVKTTTSSITESVASDQIPITSSSTEDKENTNKQVNSQNEVAVTKPLETHNDESNQEIKIITDSSRQAIESFIFTEANTESSTNTLIKGVVDEQINECGNSQRWLTSSRYDNLKDDPFLTDELAKHMILNLDKLLLPDSNMDAVMGQTICDKNSKFLNRTIPEETQYDDRMLRQWAVKLIYLGIHYHQHRLAIPEAIARYSNKCPVNELQEKYKVGIFDYECPEAKYLVMPLCGNGIGSNVRGGMVLGLMMGIITNRIVLFVSNTEQGSENLQNPWPVASCKRGDYQCVFWAPTPCIPTQDEIGQAYVLTRPNYRAITKKGIIPPDIDHHRVWTFNSMFLPPGTMPQSIYQRLYDYAQTMISAIPVNTYPNYVSLLKQAAETILIEDEGRDGYNYVAANLKVAHALTMYSVRPNPSYAYKLQEIMNEIIPSNFNPEISLGLPIRASDKCIGESECLSFDQHIQISADMWGQHLNGTGTVIDPTVVFTTESKDMIQQQQEFLDGGFAQSKYPYKFNKFVMNTKDLIPDSGFFRNIENSMDPDDIMLSSISSLKLQLMSRVTIGNCCSNFHAMLNDFLSEGCGAASDNTFMCLQEYHDPLLRVCCGWHKDCIARKEALILEKKKEAEAAAATVSKTE